MAHLAAGRAVDQLRRQLGIVLQEDNGALLGACPVEGLTPGLLGQLRALPGCRLHVLLTGARARSLGLDAKEARTVRLDAEDMLFPALQALADPLADAAPPPPETGLLPITASHDMLLTLAKYASLLPAMLTVESDKLPESWRRIRMIDVAAYWAAPSLDMVKLAEARLPVHAAEDARLAAFRLRYGTSTHLALLIGQPEGDPLVRVHSSCITGDILGSLRCDCGDQLELAVKKIAASGGGALLYLHQEGRGIGIANKLRAYALQERGVDTYEANLMLGFDEDERDFALAAAMLKMLGMPRIRLLSSNPRKAESLAAQGIQVSERVRLDAPSGRHNHAYLSAKAKRHGS